MSTLLAWFKEWRAQRARNRSAKKYLAGFHFASDTLRKDGTKGAEHLEHLVESARDFGDYSYFDAGIEARLKMEGEAN